MYVCVREKWGGYLAGRGLTSDFCTQGFLLTGMSGDHTGYLELDPGQLACQANALPTALGGSNVEKSFS